MIQLQNAFSHLLPILDDPDYIPLANSTAMDNPVAPMHNCIPHVLNDTNRLLLDYSIIQRQHYGSYRQITPELI